VPQAIFGEWLFQERYRLYGLCPRAGFGVCIGDHEYAADSKSAVYLLRGINPVARPREPNIHKHNIGAFGRSDVQGLIS
jgi:hypothetical protein